MISKASVNEACFKSSLKLFDQFLKPWNYFSLLGSDGPMMQFCVEHFVLWQCVDYCCSSWPLVGMCVSVQCTEVYIFTTATQRHCWKWFVMWAVSVHIFMYLDIIII